MSGTREITAILVFFFFLLVPGAERAFQPAYGERIREFCRGDVRSAGTFSAESVTAIL